MSWKPRHEAHAIERVRLMLQFKEPLTTKLLRLATEGIVADAAKLGFDSVSPAESAIVTLELTPNIGQTQRIAQANGNVLRRHSDGNVVEEVGLRDGVFGYVTTTYGRWENLKKRLDQVIIPATEKVSNSADLSSVKLEYWDRFTFDGPADAANAHDLLNLVDPSIPQPVAKGAAQWHSHVGWFEGTKQNPILINRNIDVADVPDERSEVSRHLAIYTLIEFRAGEQEISIGSLGEILENLHRRSVRLFGETLSAESRRKIGLDLEAYN